MSTRIVTQPNKTTIKSTTSNKTVVAYSALIGERGQDSGILNIPAEGTILPYTLVSIGSNGGVIVSNPNVTNFVVGINLTTVVAGDMASIVTIGKVTNDAWDFEPDRAVYLGLDGVVTHDPYSGNLFVCVGRSLNRNTIILQIQQPIVRVLP